MIILLRSLAFNALFYLNTLLFLIAALPTFFMPYRAIVEVAKSWGRVNLVLLRVVAGIKCEVRGLEKLPPGPLIVASKHQSAWKLCAAAVARQPVLSSARAAMDLVFGWSRSCGRMLRRRAAARRPRVMIERARAELADNRAHYFSRGPWRPAGAELALRSASRFSIWRKECLAFRSRSIPACSGRVARFAASPRRSSPKFSTRLHLGSTKIRSSLACRMTLKPRPRG